jgi:hypothetical protein
LKTKENKSIAGRSGREIKRLQFPIKSADILQPGPVALGDGLAQSCRIIRRWAEETRP